jgi:glycosyltransferase involved in cell wall biosynthesis
LATRILVVIGNLNIGGAERHLVQVLPYLMQHNFIITVFTLGRKGKLASVLEGRSVRVVQPLFATELSYFPSILRKPLLSLSAFLSFGYLLLRWRPSIVHFFLPAAYLLGSICSLLLGNRILVMSRRSLNHYQLKYPLLTKLEKRLHGHMNAVLGNSAAVVSNLKSEGVEDDRLGLLYNGIDLAQPAYTAPRNIMRQSLGISDNTFLMICVANLIPYKGHSDLICALGLINKYLPIDWAIAMVGRDSGIGIELRSAAEYYQIADHILWLGERTDAIELYAASDLGVLCSHQEGFSNSVLEGMAAKLAMVVTDVGGNAEAVLHGDCGLVVPSKNPEELGKALLTLARDSELRMRMATAGYQRVKQEFALETCINRYARLYQSLLCDPNCRVQKALDSTEINMKE